MMIYGICGEILSVIATQLLKFIFGRSRPFNFFTLNDGNMFTFFNFQYEYVSFPSGHSSGTWALIACLLFVFKDNKYSKILILFGLLISISRIILNVHYLSDVFFGAILSTFITWYTVIYLNKVKMLFPTSILVTIGCCINIFYGLVIAQRYTLYDVYWIWMVPIVVLLVLEPFLDITTGFNDEFVLSDRQIIN